MFEFCTGTLVASVAFMPFTQDASAKNQGDPDAVYTLYDTYGNDDLGLTLTSDGDALLRLWAPTAEKVMLRVDRKSVV